MIIHVVKKQVEELQWTSVIGWLNQGGVKLGISRTIPNKKMLGQMAEKIKQLNISAIVICGGTEVIITYGSWNQGRLQGERMGQSPPPS